MYAILSKLEDEWDKKHVKNCPALLRLLAILEGSMLALQFI